jgi:3-methylcrotonyl-CoA carboxylase alpha subunit
VLIANRGEIAVRVIRTLEKMDIRSIAIASDLDRRAMHVRMADEAHYVGPAPVRESYLNQAAILAAAKASGADAIHPGYGFLSENADFAEACTKAGLIFIGPPVAAIRAMGSKIEAKALMEKAGVPLVPGYHGADQSLSVLQAAADKIGYPVLIKASAGGGGKGMKIVESAKGFADALESAMREAKNAFGDDRVLIEKYLTKPRHIEVQIFGDSHRNLVHLFERDCSIQRRHQKVVEEAPAPGLSAEHRVAIGKAAIEAGRAVGYVGAGTVEFIAEDGQFYFMEMNTRLQVEHAVTEAITGLDLVEWQIRVARGEKLPKRQDEITANGHAMEARLYAEDPARDFLPQAGRVHYLRTPDDMPRVRVDSGIRSGDLVSVHYDPMIAKIIAWGPDRADAIARLRLALSETEIDGLTTNLPLLQAVLDQPEFLAGAVDTGFIARHADKLLRPRGAVSNRALALAALAVLRVGETEAATQSTDPHSPWARLPGWRLNRDAYADLLFADGKTVIPVRAHYRGAGYLLDLPDGTLEADIELEADGDAMAHLGNLVCKGHVRRWGDQVIVLLDGRGYHFTLVDPLLPVLSTAVSESKIVAPMPGTVIRVAVAVGDAVEKGAVLAIVEAMKMEHAVLAPRAGKVKEVFFEAGDMVSEGWEIVALEAAE